MKVQYLHLIGVLQSKLIASYLRPNKGILKDFSDNCAVLTEKHGKIRRNLMLFFLTLIHEREPPDAHLGPISVHPGTFQCQPFPIFSFLPHPLPLLSLSLLFFYPKVNLNNLIICI